MNDLKFAIRQLLKNPGFTAVAVFRLAFAMRLDSLPAIIQYHGKISIHMNSRLVLRRVTIQR